MEQKSEQQNSSENAGKETSYNQNSGNKIIDREKLSGSPFTIITTEDGSFLSMGKHRLTNTMEDKEAIIVHIENNMYDIISKMIIAIVNEIAEINKEAINTLEIK